MLERSEVKKIINDLTTAMAQGRHVYFMAVAAIYERSDFEKYSDLLSAFEVMVESDLMEKFKMRCAEAATMHERFRGAYVMEAAEEITSLPGGYLLSPEEMQKAADELARVFLMFE